MQKSNRAILIGLLMAMCLVIPSVMATTTLNVPVTGTNYTTINFNCTTDIPVAHNASIYYNASGGAAGTLLGTIHNDTADDTDFTGSLSIESLTDGLTYNFTCTITNSTADTETSAGVENVGIDNTNPTYTFELLKSTSANYKGTQELTWTTLDATSGVETVSVSVTSPNTDTCPTQSWSTTSGTNEKVLLDCTGTYTASMTVTDNAGNSISTEDTFKVYAPGYKDASTGVGTFSSFSIGGDSDAKGNLTTFAIIAIIILVIWAVYKK